MTTLEDLTMEQKVLLSGAARVDSDIKPVLDVDDQGNPIDPAAQPDAPAADPAAEALDRNKQLLTMALMMLKPAAPFLERCYPPEVVNNIAGAFTAVEIKRGWNVQQYLSEEFVLAVVAIPPTIQAYLLGKQYFAQLRAERAAKADQEQSGVPAAINGSATDGDQ